MQSAPHTWFLQMLKPVDSGKMLSCKVYDIANQTAQKLKNLDQPHLWTIFWNHCMKIDTEISWPVSIPKTQFIVIS